MTLQHFSVLIPHHRDDKKIYKLVETILTDPISKLLDRIVIVSPRNLKFSDKKVKFIKEPKRAGKHKAIREGLKHIKTPIVIMLTADLRMRKGFIKYLLRHFVFQDVGVVIGRPLADKNSKIYALSKLIWDLHHEACKIKPKGTEIIAFRNIIKDFPEVNADEVYIEYFFTKEGYRMVYEPEAYGYTDSPSSLTEFFRQRKRIFIGHLQIKKLYNYETFTMNIKNVTKVYTKRLSFRNWIKLTLLALIEILARSMGYIQYKITKNPMLIW